MAFIGTVVEYRLHCLLWLVEHSPGLPSSRDLAELQGVSPSFVAKILPKLEKAGILAASGGLRGGYRLPRLADQINVLDVVDAIAGQRPLFDCQQVRGQCALFAGKPPAWATEGVCGSHAVMLRAGRSMRDELARDTLSDLARSASRKDHDGFGDEVRAWLSARTAGCKPSG